MSEGSKHGGVSTFKAIVGTFSILGVLFSVAWTVYTHQPQSDRGGRSALLLRRLKKKDLELKNAEEQAQRLEQELSAFKSRNKCEINEDNPPQSQNLGKRGRYRAIPGGADAIQIISVVEGRVAWRKANDDPAKLKTSSGQPYRGVLSLDTCTTLEGPVTLAALPVQGSKKRAKILYWKLR